jgi:hypothetical protein
LFPCWDAARLHHFLPIQWSIPVLVISCSAVTPSFLYSLLQAQETLGLENHASFLPSFTQFPHPFT